MYYNDPATEIPAATGELTNKFIAFEKMIGGLDAKLEARKAALESASAKKVSAMEPDSRGAIKKIMAKSDAREVSARRRELITESGADRAKVLDHAREVAGALAIAKDMNASPLKMLSVQGIGSERRTQIQTQLDGAGPMELQSHMKRFQLEGDLEGAAACLVVMDRAPKGKYKGLEMTPAEYADQVMGEKHKQIQAAIAEAEMRVESILAVERGFVQGRTSPDDKIKIGLMKRKISAPAEQNQFRVDIAKILQENQARRKNS